MIWPWDVVEPEPVPAQTMSGSEILASTEPQPGAKRPPVRIELLPENALIVRVFQQCQLGSVNVTTAHPSGVPVTQPVWLPMSATEVHAAATLLRIPQQRWPRVLEHVRFMGQVYANTLNE